MTDGPLASGREADVFPLGDARVLRRYRDGGNATAEARVMVYLAGHGFPTPTVYQVDGPDLVMERLNGVTMAQALADGTLTIEEAGATLADLHRRLHAVPPRDAADPAARIVHLDLHPENVMVTDRGPVVIDWRNATEGSPDLDLAMSALILAQVAVDTSHRLAPAAAELLKVFLNYADGHPSRMLGHAVEKRRANPTMTEPELALLEEAAALVRDTGQRS